MSARLGSVFSLEQIIAMNGGDNTPAGDSHNLTGGASTSQPDLIEQIEQYLREQRGHDHS